VAFFFLNYPTSTKVSVFFSKAPPLPPSVIFPVFFFSPPPFGPPPHLVEDWDRPPPQPFWWCLCNVTSCSFEQTPQRGRLVLVSRDPHPIEFFNPCPPYLAGLYGLPPRFSFKGLSTPSPRDRLFLSAFFVVPFPFPDRARTPSALGEVPRSLFLEFLFSLWPALNSPQWVIHFLQNPPLCDEELHSAPRFSPGLTVSHWLSPSGLDFSR